MSKAESESPKTTLSKPSVLGAHLILELYDCDRMLLADNDRVATELENAVRGAGAHVVKTAFHEFHPGGVSGVILIAESHVTIHTWPEYGYAAIDVFTCGEDGLIERLQTNLTSLFRPTQIEARRLKRG